jgi:hypothetical protein
MNEAPMKIWLSPYMEWEEVVQQSQSDIPYIRADIVDELLKAMIVIGAGQGDSKEVAIQALENYVEEEK